MRVGMDISQLAHTGGVATYTRNLTRELSKIESLDMVYFYSSLRKPYKGKLKNVKRFHLPPTFFEKIFNKIRIVNIEKFIGNIDVFHSSDWTQPPTKAKKVTTYHDVIPLLFPNWSDPKIVKVHKKRLELVEQEIDKVIAVSESTKKDLLKISSIPEDKVVVIYEGPSFQSRKILPEEITTFKNKYNLPDKFVLAIGGTGERKNLRRIKEASIGYNLIIPGQDIPYVPEEELILLYSSATALLYPSLYEGFGLPVLDALTCGLPVITSYVSSLPEIGGDAVIYADPESVNDIKNKLCYLMEDEKLRENLAAKGLKQAAKFNWEQAAKQTFDVYTSLIDNK